ncbi:MAG: 3-hydroxyacyl-CoA dehydrogenase/enoyl-CoA hydratase/3-hydroxybutyryl-CoA epimerase [Flavobacteriales bacterium]|jgi:3-hydroxyacyl-CoA dehydrogenase/enoyl-CoA hydratase/3-hydroxybutyryl-CoA epimerase/enoyl-CoA isomerase
MFSGKAFSLVPIDDGLVELIFDLQGESVNKFNMLAMTELSEVLSLLESSSGVNGLLVRSAKDAFVAGADINEFGLAFLQGPDAIRSLLAENNKSFCRLEDLPFPTVVAVSGYAFGGGMEFCLSCDYRIAAENTKLGLPEVKLGIIPGWGGTVRLPRVAGLDVAIEWISSGKEQKASKALTDGVFDGVVSTENLRGSALSVLRDLASGELDFKKRRIQKQSPLRHNDIEALLAFESSKAFVKAQAGRNYPAPVKAIESMQNGAKLDRDAAIAVETDIFVEIAQLPTTINLSGLFVSDQLLNKKAKRWEKSAVGSIHKAAVLGAGIMGGGIAYQSAYKGVPVVMKDIAQAGLDLGLSEASKLLAKLAELGRIDHAKMAQILTRIDSSLLLASIEDCDIVVEAVVENESVKKAVLAEAETSIRPDTVLCSNTSTISISSLATALKRPENFCGMHFFNPVHKMPLVEVIRGDKTSDSAIAKTVAYANKLGKKAVVVNDCPGFLVNRVLFPYFSGFAMLIRDGADFQKVDKVMERWGWPMGPAYLMDVVGIDTGVHAEKVMAEGFPDRLAKTFKAASDVMFEAGRFGQKNGEGFYSYKTDKKGKPQKLQSDEAYALLKPISTEPRDFSDEEIVERMMIPMANELIRCLDEGVVGSAEEADMALIYGLGFPPFRGGVFRWIDSLGAGQYAKLTEKYHDLGALYPITEAMQVRVDSNDKFYRLGV